MLYPLSWFVVCVLITDRYSQVYRLQGAGFRVAVLSVRPGVKTTAKFNLCEDPVLSKTFQETSTSTGKTVLNAYGEAILKAFLHGKL